MQKEIAAFVAKRRPQSRGEWSGAMPRPALFMATLLTKTLDAPRNILNAHSKLAAHMIHSPSVSPTIELWSQGVA
jgi:hypothetical protein